MKKLSQAGILTGVVFTPIVPYILDNDKNLEDVIKRTSEAGAKSILPGSMTLRSNQKIRFMQLLKEKRPELVEKYERLYAGSQGPNQEYIINLNKKIFELCKKFNIPIYMPPPDFDRPLKENFDVANLLLLIAYFKERRTGNPYVAWAYHKAAQNIEELEENIRDIHERYELRKIPAVGESLARTIAEFLDTGKS